MWNKKTYAANCLRLVNDLAGDYHNMAGGVLEIQRIYGINLKDLLGAHKLNKTDRFTDTLKLLDYLANLEVGTELVLSEIRVDALDGSTSLRLDLPLKCLASAGLIKYPVEGIPINTVRIESGLKNFRDDLLRVFRNEFEFDIQCVDPQYLRDSLVNGGILEA